MCAVFVFAFPVNAIDEVVDNYADASKVNVTYQVINNSTLEVMELNFTASQNFNAWTEVDIGGDHIMITAPKVAWNNQPRAGDTRAYQDYGVGFYGDFSTEFEMEYSNVEAGDASDSMINTPFAVSNSNGDWDAIWASQTLLIYASQDGVNDNRIQFILYTRSGGATIGSSAGIVRNLAKYYMRVSRTGGTFKAQFYSDAGRTALVFQLSCNAPLNTLRYFQIAVSRNHPADGTDHSTGYIQNLDGGEYVLSGYFTTTNFMTGLNENITVVLLNSTIPEGSINLEISETGIVWTDLGLITGGYDCADLRSLGFTDAVFRCNFTRGASLDVTPRLNQIRLIHEGAGVGPSVNVTGAWTEYNFTWIQTLIGVNTSVGGNWLNQTYWLDDYQFNVTEVIGAPGYDIRFDVSGLPDNLICLQLVGFMAYDGSAGHTFEVQAYNYSSASWVTVSDIPDTSKRWINGSIDCTSGDFIQNGLFQGRYYHPSPGNINHHFCLDYGKLRAFAPSITPTPSDDRFIIGLFIGIALLIIAYLYYEHGR